MSVVRAQVAIDHSSALPEDVVVNTFHFATATPPVPAELANITDALSDFYRAASPGGSVGTLMQYMSRELGTNAKIRLYNLDDPEPRVPLTVIDMPWSPPASDNALPEEVALCLSFHGTQVSGQDQKNKRGRVYIGPINGNANTISGRPTAALIARLVAGADALMSDPDTNWGVWSPTTLAFHTITGGWVDDAFDTIRSRGQAPLARSTFA